MRVRAAILALAMLASAAPVAAQDWRGDGRGHGREHGWPGREGRGGGPVYAPPGYGGPGRGRGYPPGGYAPPGMLGFGGPPMMEPAPFSPREVQEEARRAVREGHHRSLSEILPSLRGRMPPGRMLDARMEPGPAGRPVYHVIWAAANGRRMEFDVDPETGALLGGGR